MNTPESEEQVWALPIDSADFFGHFDTSNLADKRASILVYFLQLLNEATNCTWKYWIDPTIIASANGKKSIPEMIIVKDDKDRAVLMSVRDKHIALFNAALESCFITLEDHAKAVEAIAGYFAAQAADV